jgi:hypothetical protein
MGARSRRRQPKARDDYMPRAVIKNADLRTTVSGDARVDAYKLQQQTRAKINDDLDAYCAMVRALAGVKN